MVLMIRFIHNHPRGLGVVMYKKFIFNNLHYLTTQLVWYKPAVIMFCVFKP
jgi:hypothetical protein